MQAWVMQLAYIWPDDILSVPVLFLPLSSNTMFKVEQFVHYELTCHDYNDHTATTIPSTV